MSAFSSLVAAGAPVKLILNVLNHARLTGRADAGHIQPAVAGRTAGSGQEAAQTCYVRDFLWVNHEESSGWPNATSCSLAAARHGPLCPKMGR
eukprot:scaffold12872_cov124-Isochrysis_galbana.AAC.1